MPRISRRRLKTRTRYFRAFGIAGILAAALGTYVGHLAYPPSPQTPPRDPGPFEANLPTEVSAIENAPAAESAEPGLVHSDDKSTAEEHAADQEVVKLTVQRIHEALAKAELSSARLIEDRTLPNKLHVRVLELPPVSEETVTQAHAEISRGLKALSPESPLAEKLKTEALRKIARFTDRPKPFRVLFVEGAPEKTKDVWFYDLFFDDLPTARNILGADGKPAFTEGSGPGEAVARIGIYRKGEIGTHGKDDAWARMKYGHFFGDAPPQR
jgi:hypothetical protein